MFLKKIVLVALLIVFLNLTSIKAGDVKLQDSKQNQLEGNSGSIITINHMQFRDLKTGIMTGWYAIIHSSQKTRAQCAEACMEHKRCVTWSTLYDIHCYGWAFAPRTRPRVIYHWTPLGQTFEIMVKVSFSLLLQGGKNQKRY